MFESLVIPAITQAMWSSIWVILSLEKDVSLFRSVSSSADGIRFSAANTMPSAVTMPMEAPACSMDWRAYSTW